MKYIHLFYIIKPVIPRSLQLLLRRSRASYLRTRHSRTWPIDESAVTPPARWSGWPEHKRFALVLSHDVDTQKGHDRVSLLMEKEKGLGFFSSFNFVVEDYSVSSELRAQIEQNGFEVGLHGLHHDGKLFRSLKGFFYKVPRINQYLKDWGAVGFHSPSTHRDLNWILDLNIEYDSSTFDTDPFEPQSEGMKTIFPFCVKDASNNRSYVELPYTLPQDHCIFSILREKNIDIWKQKLDWIAANGGLALINTHPDYMSFDNSSPRGEQYPTKYYLDFLDYIKSSYRGQYWNPLAKHLARYWKQNSAQEECQISGKGNATVGASNVLLFSRGARDNLRKTKVWIDLDNTPHVPFFIPIIRELDKRGYKVLLTARDAFQVCALADKKGLTYTKIGQHYGRNPFMKVAGLFWRSIQLLAFYRRFKPDIALSHGSRSQILLANMIGLPSILIMDYEHSRTIPLAHPRWEIVPDALRSEKVHTKPENVLYYKGIKEDVYVREFRPSTTAISQLGLSEKDIIITVRPPADMAHYRNPESDELMYELMERIVKSDGTRVILLPRNAAQEADMKRVHSEWFRDQRTIVPSSVMDGLDLLWNSDLVVSGGGTMNREAAALGIPVFSIFRGKTGAVDQMLERDGRLVLIRNTDEIWTKIPFTRRDKNRAPARQPQSTLEDIVNHIEEIIGSEWRVSESRKWNHPET